MKKIILILSLLLATTAFSETKFCADQHLDAKIEISSLEVFEGFGKFKLLKKVSINKEVLFKSFVGKLPIERGAGLYINEDNLKVSLYSGGAVVRYDGEYYKLACLKDIPKSVESPSYLEFLKRWEYAVDLNCLGEECFVE